MGGWVGGWVGGWPGSDNMTISVQLDLTGTSTGTELGNTLPWDREDPSFMIGRDFSEFPYKSGFDLLARLFKSSWLHCPAIIFSLAIANMLSLVCLINQ